MHLRLHRPEDDQASTWHTLQPIHAFLQQRRQTAQWTAKAYLELVNGDDHTLPAKHVDGESHSGEIGDLIKILDVLCEACLPDRPSKDRGGIAGSTVRKLDQERLLRAPDVLLQDFKCLPY